MMMRNMIIVDKYIAPNEGLVPLSCSLAVTHSEDLHYNSVGSAPLVSTVSSISLFWSFSPVRKYHCP